MCENPTGMGETVFAPSIQALSSTFEGVRFRSQMGISHELKTADMMPAYYMLHCQRRICGISNSFSQGVEAHVKWHAFTTRFTSVTLNLQMKLKLACKTLKAPLHLHYRLHSYRFEDSKI